MLRQRFKRSGMGSMFRGFVYERVVPRNPHLVELQEVTEWDTLPPILVPTYGGLAERGCPPYSPVVMRLTRRTQMVHYRIRQGEENTRVVPGLGEHGQRQDRRHTEALVADMRFRT